MIRKHLKKEPQKSLNVDICMLYIPNQRRWGEIIALTFTGLSKFLFMDLLELRFLYISVACLGWAFYMLYRSRKQKELLAYWGFRKDNFYACLKLLLPWALLSVAAFVIYGFMTEKIILSWHIIPILLLYPIWGIIQHLLMIALFAGNLKDQDQFKLSDTSIIFLTALLFSFIHFPHILLVVGTFLLALVYTYVYLKEKNLWVLGILHGWLGAIFFYTVLERDPWIEVFARL